MASLITLRQALADTIKANVAADLFVYDTVPEMANLPAIIVEPDASSFTETLNAGWDEWEFNVFVMCSRAVPFAGQNSLDSFVDGWGPNSIRKALFNTPDLGIGDDTDALVVGMRGYGGNWAIANIDHIGAVLRVRARTNPK